MPINENEQATVVNELECGVTMQSIGSKWKMSTIYNLSNGLSRFSTLKRLILGVTQKMLVQQLRELESHGIVNRKVYAVV